MNKCFYRHRNQNRISINTYLPRIINPHPASLTPLPPLTSLTPAPPPPARSRRRAGCVRGSSPTRADDGFQGRDLLRANLRGVPGVRRP